MIAAVALLAPAAWAGPYTSKFQNSALPENTAATPTETGPEHGHMNACRAKAMKAKCPTEGMKAKCRAAGMQNPDMRHAGMKCFMDKMSDKDRAQFKSIHEKLNKNPDVQAAHQAVKNAEGKDAKRAAFKKLREVNRAAMSEEDRAFMDGLREKMKANKTCKKCSG